MASAVKDAVQDVTEGVKNLVASDKPKKQQAPKKEKKPKAGNAAGLDELAEPPEYFDHRIKIFDKLKAQYDAEIAKKPRETITITLPDGSSKFGTSWETSPAEIARGISKSLFEKTVIAKVDGVLWDMERPLEQSCSLTFLDFNNDEGRGVFWHSSAHILGEAAERRFACSLCIGPPTDSGFYYEMALPEGGSVGDVDHEPLERIAAKIVQEKQPFVRLELSKDDLLEMFKTNKYKQHIIKDKIQDGTKTTVYRCGPLIDLCRGPHVPHTGRVKAFKVLKNSASYFLGDQKNDSLQRIYGVSFPDKKELKQHLEMLEEAAKRDHRRIGVEQELFFFHHFSPGSAFFLPHGMRIYNTLMQFLRSEYWNREYQEVSSPNMFNSELWKTSGHWQHYSEDMFVLDVEKEKFALKPMNCPGHCLIFGMRERSYRELPIRMAEFGVLHRNEASGALSGLTRVRRFVQDDTHVFCTVDQIEEEISDIFSFFEVVYKALGLKFKMKLSTRPEGFLGKIEDWDKAESLLTRALDKFINPRGETWELNPGDGAFYGPKIDIKVSDALGRDFQCATVQLDFQLPQRFDLQYMSGAALAGGSAQPATSEEKTEKKGEPGEPLPGYSRPVMVHRAIIGSFERMLGILVEHFAGRWPFWLSPRQILVVPVLPQENAYVQEIRDRFREAGFFADADVSGKTMKQKIAIGQSSLYNFIFVVGPEEHNTKSVNIRNRDAGQENQKRAEVVPVDIAIEKLKELKESKSLDHKSIRFL